MIRDGDAELVLAGSADCSLSPLWLAAYQQMGVLASEHPESRSSLGMPAVRPNQVGFRRRRRSRHAAPRIPGIGDPAGRSTLARLAGWAAGSDPQGLIQLSEADSPLAEVIEKAISRAGLGPQDVACVCAHGTATIANDRTEIDSFRRVFGRHLTSLPVVSAKGAVGHLMGAAGAVETALAILTRFHGESPGTSTSSKPTRG